MSPQQITDLVNQILDQQGGVNTFTTAQVPFHVHNGLDSNKVSYTDLINRDDSISWTLPGTSSATAGNYSVFFTAPFALTIGGVTEVHTTAGSDGSAVTLDVEKLVGITAPGSGVVLTISPFNLKATANTVQTAMLSNVVGAIHLNVGDRLALKLTGTPTSLANVSVTITINY